jgi:hypothetical protein
MCQIVTSRKVGLSFPKIISGHFVCLWYQADIAMAPINVRFSNRPIGVKRFQAINHYLSDYPPMQWWIV